MLEGILNLYIYGLKVSISQITINISAYEAYILVKHVYHSNNCKKTIRI